MFELELKKLMAEALSISCAEVIAREVKILEHDPYAFENVSSISELTLLISNCEIA